ncbi:aurora kinase A-interacting protein [Patescibacteria group bacterium]|nr:aurora kinase A-interacting protein [Patescibacteria group bacterium]
MIPIARRLQKVSVPKLTVINLSQTPLFNKQSIIQQFKEQENFSITFLPSVVPQLKPFSVELEPKNTTQIIPFTMDSLVRKRKKKMSKHRYEKRIKKMKALMRKLGK